MPEVKQLTQVHLAVYGQLMEWRRHMYEEQKDGNNTVLGIAGEAWSWASLTQGDLGFIAKEVDKLISIVRPQKTKKTKVAKEKLDESDLTL